MFLKRPKQHKASPQVNQFDVPGGLEPSQLKPRLTSHYGVPSTASSLSFDPFQHVLAICTSDGRLKLYGRDGVEGVLQSDLRVQCKFVEFVNNRGEIINITVQNDIQIWDLEKKELVHSHTWDAKITAFAVIQGCPYVYIGEDSGDLVVLQYDKEENRLCQMPYSIPVQATLGGMAKATYNSAPSVIGILPQPDAEYSRVLIAYGNGLIVLWGLHESQVIAVRGSRVNQWQKLAFNTSNQGDNEADDPSSSSDQEDEDICCLCWACPSGSLLATGYTDGDIWFWSMPTLSRGLMDQEKSGNVFLSDVPVLRLQVSSSKQRSPVVLLRWSTSGKADTGNGGRLYVFGGSDLTCPEVLTIFSLNWSEGHLDANNISHLELSLHGRLDDMILLPSVGSTLSEPAAALLVLTTPGQLHAYDDASISGFFNGSEQITPTPIPEPILIQSPFAEPCITAAKLIVLGDGMTSRILSLLPHSFKGMAPSVLPSGTKWPITGGVIQDGHSSKESVVRRVYVSGHRDGSVNIWDASSAIIHLCSLRYDANMESLQSGAAPISILEFCPLSGVLVVADECGLVRLYALSSEAGEVGCIIVNKATKQERVVHQNAGFQCILISDLHQATISSIAVASTPARVAIGCNNGLVSLFDVSSRSLLYHGSCFSDRPQKIVSLLFGPVPAKDDMSSPSSSSSNTKQMSEAQLASTALYAAAEDASMVALDGETGMPLCSAPWHVEHPSPLLSLRLLEVAEDFPNRGSNVNISPSEESLTEKMGEDYSFPASGTTSAPSHVLLCYENSVQIYSLSSLMQGICTSLHKVSLQMHCCWASNFFYGSSHATGLVLMDNTGLMQVRSLPDLGILHESHLEGCLNWKLKPGSNFSSTLTCAANGQIALIDGEKELIFLSLLVDEKDCRFPDSVSSFFDKDIASATDAALKAGSHPTRRKSQIQGFLGGVLKEIKGGMLKSTTGKEQFVTRNSATELDSLFAISPFAITNAVANIGIQSHTEATENDVVELDIDDIDVDDEEEEILSGTEIRTPAASGSSSGEKKISELKGKQKQSESTDDRVQLLGDDETRKPTRRTAEQIKAAYGHRKTGEVSGAAGLARDKLLERQEKLQALSKRTEEMQEGAENFSSMAAELAKAMEGRKWWQL